VDTIAELQACFNPVDWDSVRPSKITCEEKVAHKIGRIRAADASARDASSGTSLGVHARAQDRQDAGYHANLHDRLQPDIVPRSHLYAAVQIFDAEDHDTIV
jgi:hypothetical protein